MQGKNYAVEALPRPFKIQCPKNWMLVRILEHKSVRTKGGILIPETAAAGVRAARETEEAGEKMIPMATILQVGPLVGDEWGEMKGKLYPYKAGDTIYFATDFPIIPVCDDTYMVNVDAVMFSIIPVDDKRDGEVFLEVKGPELYADDAGELLGGGLVQESAPPTSLSSLTPAIASATSTPLEPGPKPREPREKAPRLAGGVADMRDMEGRGMANVRQTIADDEEYEKPTPAV